MTDTLERIDRLVRMITANPDFQKKLRAKLIELSKKNLPYRELRKRALQMADRRIR